MAYTSGIHASGYLSGIWATAAFTQYGKARKLNRNLFA